MLTDFPLEEDIPPQTNFTFFKCCSGRYDASELAVSSGENGIHVWITDWAGVERAVLLQPSDARALRLRAETLIQVCSNGSLWLPVQMLDEDGSIEEVLLSDDQIDRFFDCLVVPAVCGTAGEKLGVRSR